MISQSPASTEASIATALINLLKHEANALGAYDLRKQITVTIPQWLSIQSWAYGKK